MKISGRHKSVPKELKKSLSSVLIADTKVVMNDICSCRHAFSPGTLRITEETTNSLKLRGYFGSGIVNFFVKFATETEKNTAINKIQQKFPH